MTRPKYYSVKTLFGEFGPSTVKQIVAQYNALVEQAGLGRGHRIHRKSLERFLRQGNARGHFRNLVVLKRHGKRKAAPTGLST